MPTPSDVHVNQPLTMISEAYIQTADGFVAGQVFPIIPVRKQSDRYWTYDRSYFNRDEMEVRAPGTESKGTTHAIDSTPTYYAPVRALHEDVSDDERDNADAMVDPDRDATEVLTVKGLINREVTWVTNYFAGGVWTGGDLDGAAASPATGEFLQWNDASSTPIEDIRTGGTAVQQSCGGPFRPNKFVCGREVYDKLADHPDLVDRVKYSGGVGNEQPAMVGRRAMAALFEVDEVLVATGIQNTANEGASAVHAFIAGKKALLVYAAASPGLKKPSGGYTIVWTQRVGASAANQGFVISKFRRSPEFKADRVEIESAHDLKVIGTDLGYFFDTAVA